MTAVTIFAGSHCHGLEVAQRVAETLGVPLHAEDVFQRVAALHGVTEERIVRSLHGPASLLDGLRGDRELHIAWVRQAMAELVEGGDSVYLGFGVHLIPKNIGHVLKVCLIANKAHRIAVAAKAGGTDDRKARKLVETEDAARIQWTQHLLDLGPWDERLYDEIIPMHTTSVDDAARMIADNARRPALAATDASRAAAADFGLAARVHLALADKGHEVDVSCAAGAVTVTIRKSVARVERLEAQLKQLAAAVPGVRSVQTRLGPKFRPPSVHRDLDLDTPSRILLVDDEREFVHTLSERLEVRNIGAAVAYDGEDALAYIRSEAPEVMVLDLKMPGIDGIEVLRRAKTEHPEVEVIILTGHGSEIEEAQALELGAFAYLQKPVDIELLARTMRAAYRKVYAHKADDPSDDDPREPAK